MDTLRQDIRYGLRSMRRSRGFTLTVLLTLGVGIGANTAIFSFVDAMLLRPLPYPDPNRMVMVWEDFSASGGPEREWFTPPDLRDLRERSTTLDAVSGLVNWGPSLTGAGDPEVLMGSLVQANWFDFVAVAPERGRAFLPEDEQGDGRVVILSQGLWQRRFGGDESIVGRDIQLNGEAYRVVGVMPAGFSAPFLQTDIWGPLTTETFGTGCTTSRSCYVVRVLARMREGVTDDAVRNDLAVLATAIREEAPGEKQGMAFRVDSLRDQLTSNVRPALWALLGAVGLLLLVACVNIANLLLAKGAAREREMAVRTAIGARSRTILRQLLVESALLGLAGGLVGILLSLWGVSLLRGMSPAGTPRLDEVAVDGRILLFAISLSLLTSVLFGLAPALQLARTDLARVLREAGSIRGSRARKRLRGGLVVAEMALALTLLAGAGLLLRSFARLQSVDPGFNPENVLAVSIAFPRSRYEEPAKTNAAVSLLIERLSTRSGVEAVGGTTIIPLNPGDNDVSFLIEGQPAPQDRTEVPVAWYRQITPGYFDAIGMRLQRGRGFTPEDRAGSMPVAIINETLARRHWLGGDAIGQRITSDPDEPWTTIVGVVADTRHTGPDQPTRGELFLPLAQQPARFITLAVRTAGDPLALVPAVRAEVSAIDPDLPLGRTTTMEEALDQAVALPRLYLSFFAFFAAVALVLAGVGLYGVVSQTVAQRTSEIGVRMALGAGARDVARLVLGQALTLVMLGVVAGTALALSLSRSLSRLLFDVSSTDPATFVTIVIVLAAVALVASWLPARRATRVDPLHALRGDV